MKDEPLSRATTQALYLCGLPAFVVFCSVAQLSGTAVWATVWTGIWLAFTVPVPLATLVRDGRALRRTTRRRRRSAAAEAWAEAHGWSHVRASSAVPRSGRDVLRAVRDGVQVVSYETIAAPDLVSESPLLTRHAVAAAVPGDLPQLIVLPETPVREAGAARWARDIQFESAAFNARWRVHCADERFAHAFCHPRVMERLMRPDADGVGLLVDGREVVVHAPGPQRLELLDARAARRRPRPPRPAVPARAAPAAHEPAPTAKVGAQSAGRRTGTGAGGLLVRLPRDDGGRRGAGVVPRPRTASPGDRCDRSESRCPAVARPRPTAPSPRLTVRPSDLPGSCRRSGRRCIRKVHAAVASAALVAARSGGGAGMVISGDVVSFLSLLPWLIVPVVLVAVIWYQVRRNKRIKAWATASGWTYVGTDRSLVDRWQGEPFGRGHTRTTSEVMVGRWAGRPAISFTYSYRTGSGKDESTSSYHVIALPLPTYLPTLELTPEGLGTRLARVFGGQDIQFESEEFNRAWRVESWEAKFAHDVVHPRLMERLMRADARGVSLRISGTDILTWAAGQTVPERIAGRLGLMSAVIDSVPRYVWQDHGFDPGPPVVRPGIDGTLPA